MTLTLDALNRMNPGDFTSAVGDTFELAPWVAESAATRRPFQTVTTLHEAMMGAVRAAPRERQVEFLRGHPDLAGKAARAGAMTTIPSASRQVSAWTASARRSSPASTG